MKLTSKSLSALELLKKQKDAITVKAFATESGKSDGWGHDVLRVMRKNGLVEAFRRVEGSVHYYMYSISQKGLSALSEYGDSLNGKNV